MAGVAVSSALALVGNLATNTVSVHWRWWPAVTWTVTLLLVVLAVVAQTTHHRQSGTGVVTVEDAALALKNGVQEQWSAEAADLLARTGRVDEAVGLLRPRALGDELRSWTAARRLVDILVQAGKVDEPAAVLRARADHHAPDAYERLDDILAQPHRS